MVGSYLSLPTVLEVALEREVEGDLFLQDIGQGFGFRPGSFDGAIRCAAILHPGECPANLSSSISVIQWLLNAETSHPTSSPPHRLTRFFTTLHSALRNPSRAVFQFYPTSDDQIQLITSIAQKAGFGGGVVVDYPNSKKARKVYLCLFVGSGGGQHVPKGLEGEEEVGSGKAKFEARRERSGKKADKKRKNIKDRDWILKKKEVSFVLNSHDITMFMQTPKALPETREGECTQRLKIYRTETQSSILTTYLILVVSN